MAFNIRVELFVHASLRCSWIYAHASVIALYGHLRVAISSLFFVAVKAVLRRHVFIQVLLPLHPATRVDDTLLE